MCFKHKKRCKRELASFCLFFFLFAFAKQLLQERSQKRGGAPYKHFHRHLSFPYQFGSTVYAAFFQNVRAAEKILIPLPDTRLPAGLSWRSGTRPYRFRA